MAVQYNKVDIRVDYRVDHSISVDQFTELLLASTLSERRPMEDTYWNGSFADGLPFLLFSR